MSKKKGRRRLMWGLCYAAAFLTAFVLSAVVKMTYNPLGDKYAVVWDDSVGTIYTDLFYSAGEVNKFDLYVPADRGKDRYGLVVYLHAGGFTSGDKAGDADMLKFLCSKGYVAAGINYTLRTEQNEASVYSQSQEIKDSIPAVVAEAKKLGYPLDRMTVSGGSAGGCLALLYAYRDGVNSPLPVTMVFEAVGPASFHHEDWTSYGLDQNPEGAAVLFSVMSGNTITPEMVRANDYQEEAKDISAYRWVTEDSPPTLCAYGVYDKVCPVPSASHLIRALEAHNVPHDVIEFPHSGHGLQNDNDCYAVYMEQLITYLNEYMG